MLHRLYDRVLALSASRWAGWWLAAVAFAEASFFPVPPDALLIPMALARPDRALRLALICTLGSVAGGALGYLIGYELFNVAAAPILHAYHYDAAFARFQETYARWGVYVILVKGLTPIPYKLVTIASGAAHFDFVVFMAASLLTRGARFFLLAVLLRYFGVSVRQFIETRLVLVTTLLGVGVIGGFAVLRFL
jgi:membrane protein YqaA with SNARE-associated domain